MKACSAVIILVFWSLSSFTPDTAYSQKERGVKVRTAPKVHVDQIYGNLWAVVIGINRYKNWDHLEYAVNDARSVKNLLVQSFGFQQAHIIELLDEEATLINIRTTLGGVLPQKTAKNDGVLIFFAGHGETVDLPSGGNLGYLVPVDGSIERGDYFATLLPMTQIREICSLIPAKHIFFVVDACYSGLAAASERGMSSDTRQYISKLASMRCRQILTAGGKGEQVIEKAEWGHSAFTYKLLEGLGAQTADSDQDGIITSGEIGTYIKSRVPRISNNRQTPQFKNLTNDEGEFIFIPSVSKAVPGTRDADPDKPDDNSLKMELEKLKKENELLRELREKERRRQPKKEGKDSDEIFTPPP